MNGKHHLAMHARLCDKTLAVAAGQFAWKVKRKFVRELAVLRNGENYAAIM